MTIKQIDSDELNLVVDLFDKYRIFYKQPSDLELAKIFLQQRLHNKESVIFVALKDGVSVGFTQLYPTYSSMRAVKNWILNDLYVETIYRKQGVGEALIRRAMDFAKKDGAKYVALSTAVDNATAQQLYESIGFKKQTPDNQFYDYRISL